MAHTLIHSYSDYSYSSHDESQTEGEGDTLQWRQRQDERAGMQKKTFAKWINYQLHKGGKEYECVDVVKDLQDGTLLLALLEVLTGKRLRRERGRMRLHMLNNVNRVIQTLEENNVKLVNISSDDVVNGNAKLILGLIWSIILQFQVKSAMSQFVEGVHQTDVEKTLLNWCKHAVRGYKGVNIKNFTTSWQDGLAFNALVHHHRPDVFNYNSVIGRPAFENLEHAFRVAREHLGIEPLLDPEDVKNHPDKKSILMYLTTLFEAMSGDQKPVIIEEISESSENELQARDSPTPSSISTLSEWEDYNETLTQVLTWLLQAETQLKQQAPVSIEVDVVKEQFREHEEFMMVLTSHQSNVGGVLEFGSQLINEGIVAGKEEREIREQMTVLSDRWENLRVGAMERQTKLHQALMAQQQRQLQELADWLTTAELRMEKSISAGSDIDSVKAQVDEHKKFQEDLELQQQHVNSLSHMVVVVDESENENATADLEEQLALLGERWSAICKWTEQRWALLQEILNSWQLYRGEEKRLSDWLCEKEAHLKKISQVDLGDKEALSVQLQQLKMLEQELTAQQSKFGDFNMAAQQVATNLDEDSPAIEQIQLTMESFNRRWNTIASQLNAKIRLLKGVEEPLKVFLTDYEETIAWINTNHQLLTPVMASDHVDHHKDLIESVDASVKQRQPLIQEITKKGKDIIVELKSNHQSTLGLEQCVTSVNEKWAELCELIGKQISRLALAEKKRQFRLETKRILTVVTEIEIWIQTIIIEHSKDPQYQTEQIKLKLGELSTHMKSLESLQSQARNIEDDSLRLALVREVETIKQRFITAHQTLQQQQSHAIEMIQSTPPPEYQERYVDIKVAVDDALPHVTKEFQYAELSRLEDQMESCKLKQKKVSEQESNLSYLNKKQAEMLKNLSPEKSTKLQKQLHELMRLWSEVKGKLESRLQRIRDAITQTKELQLAMKETFNWMDDVDKFLADLSGTIAEGDSEAVESQVEEVEALQADISTVQKKVDSLIETCTYMMNRAEPLYADVLKAKLAEMNKRWEYIVQKTEQEKTKLQSGLDKFRFVDSGIKEIYVYLKSLENMIQSEELDSMDSLTAQAKVDQYKEALSTMQTKDHLVKKFETTTAELLSDAPQGTSSPVNNELENLKKSFLNVQTQLINMKGVLDNGLKDLLQLHHLLAELYKVMDDVDECISKSSDALDGDEHDLESCLNTLNSQYTVLKSEKSQSVEPLVTKINSGQVGTKTASVALKQYNSRLGDTLERGDKVRHILEGELMKRQQLTKDLVWLSTWLERVEKELSMKVTAAVDEDTMFNESLKEELSLNQTMLQSAENTVKELMETGKPERHDKLLTQLKNIKAKWTEVTKLFEEVKLKPLKDLEVRFVSLHGNILSEMDNIIRKVKKLKMESPGPVDIQCCIDNLEEYKGIYDSIANDIDKLKEIGIEIKAKTGDEKGAIERSLNEVQNEHQSLGKAMEEKKTLFTETLPIAEDIEKEFGTLDQWVKDINAKLRQEIVDLPENPEPEIENIKRIIDDLNDHGPSVEKLKRDSRDLLLKGDSPAFQALGTKVTDLYTVWLELSKEARERLEALQKWLKLIDDYERHIDDYNVWIDNIEKSLDLLGYQEKKIDLMSELEELKKLKEEFDQKETKLDTVKTIADDIASRGRPSLVQPYEKQIYARLDELEKNFELKSSDIEQKILILVDEERKEKEEEEARLLAAVKQLEEEKLKEKRVEVVEEEVILPDAVRVAESAPESVDESPVNVELVTQDESVSSGGDEMWIMRRQPESSVRHYAEVKFTVTSRGADKGDLHQKLSQIIVEIEDLEKSIVKIRIRSRRVDDVKEAQNDAENIKRALEAIQPRIDALMKEAGSVGAQPEEKIPQEIQKTVTELNRKVSVVHSNLTLRRRTLKGVDMKFVRYQHDLDAINKWVDDAEAAIDDQADKERMKELDGELEKRVAEMEAVVVRANQLNEVCAENEISKPEVENLTKKLYFIQTRFQQYRKPEEKVTTYKISVFTADVPEGDTRANVYIKLFGEYGNSEQFALRQSETKRKKFLPGQVDVFTFRDQQWLGKLSKIRIWHDNEGSNPSWYLSSVYVLDELSARLYGFNIDSWLSKEHGAVLKETNVGGVTLFKELAPEFLTKKHKIVEVNWIFDTFTAPSEVTEMSWKQYVNLINSTCDKVTDLKTRLADPVFDGKEFQNFSEQEQKLKAIEETMEKIAPCIDNLVIMRERHLSNCSPTELDTIDKSLNKLRSNWNAVNSEFRIRFLRYDKSASTWRQVHNDLKEITLWLTKTENKLAETKLPNGEINTELAKQEQEGLERGLADIENRLNTCHLLGEDIITESADNDAELFRGKLSAIDSRWNVVHGEIKDRKKRFLTMENRDLNVFLEDCDGLLSWIENTYKLITEIKPHPIDEDALDEYIDRLNYAEEELSSRQESLLNITNRGQKILAKSEELSLQNQTQIKDRTDHVQKRWQQVSLALPKRKAVITEKLSRATKFLEELEELSVWMSATRDLLEKQDQGDPSGLLVDPETMRQALETRKSNVEAINKLLSEFRGEGDLTTTTFPKEVRDKIEKLNKDWQIIIQLATKLREKTVVSESVIVAEELQKESAPMEFAMPDKTDFAPSVAVFDQKVAQINDWLKLMEKKTNARILIGDSDEFEAFIQQQTTFDVEMEMRKNMLEDTVEMGAAVASNSTNEPTKYAVDDKITKLKEHWEAVSMKLTGQKRLLQDVNEEWSAFEELKIQLENWIQGAEAYFSDASVKEPGSTVTELEEQIQKHKEFHEGLVNIQSIMTSFCEAGESMMNKYPGHDLSIIEKALSIIKARFQDIQERSSNRQQTLQDSLDRLLQFHKNMITALTWLSSAESKVADLDSIVEASQTEEQIDMDELQKELVQLEEDIGQHQSMFSSLNETGQQIISDLEPGEVLTALQSKLDDMNDRWNSLGVRVVDIRDRLSDGTGEWRQLLLDMQEIIDWLIRADQELSSQKPIGGDLETVQQQNENHQAFKGKLNVRRLIIDQALQQGRQFLSKNEATSSIERRYSNEALVMRVADNLRKHLTHVEEQWEQLMHKSEDWQKILDDVLHLLHTLIAQIDEVTHRLDKAEKIKSRWPPVENSESLQVQLNELKVFMDDLSNLEAQFDNMDGTAKELRQFHCVALSGPLEAEIDQLHRRWNQLHIDCVDRQRAIQDLLSEYDISGSGELAGSVIAPWERSLAVNKVPYYINHDTKTTQWDHPKMTSVYQTLSELNDVKFAAYRTAMKLRCIQKACCLDLVNLNVIRRALETNDAMPPKVDKDALVDTAQIINVLVSAFEKAEHRNSINFSQCVDLTLNWILNVFDSVRYGKIRCLSLAIALILLCRGSLDEKWKCIFLLLADVQGHVDQKSFGLLMHDCIQIPRQLGEVAAFGGSNIEPSVRSCFENARSSSKVDVSHFLSWVALEPQSLVWMPVLHRLAAAETAKHEAKCNICKEYPIVGFRYRCLKCFNYDVCQNCFWSGRTSKSHRITHPMHQYSLTTTTGEDLSDFVKLLRNKFKSKRYRNRPPKKLGYLPVQTVFEGSTVESPPNPSSPDMSNYSSNSLRVEMDGANMKMGKFQMDEEHRLIQQLCNTLSKENRSAPRSPAQIIAELEHDQNENLDSRVKELEEEHKALQEEYDRLKQIRSQDMNGTGHSISPSDSNRDAELQAEAKVLRHHKGRLEARMQILEDHNKQLEAQLQRLRQLLEQPSADRDKNSLNVGFSSSLPRSTNKAPTPSETSAESITDTNGIEISENINGERNYEIKSVSYKIEQTFPAREGEQDFMYA